LTQLPTKPIVPRELRPGDRVRVIAPSGPFDRALVLKGLGWLSSRYEVVFGAGLFQRDGFLAGTDARRLDELRDAFADQSARAVVVARGGYGLTRIAHAIGARCLRDDPKWIVGFSDVTALHVEAQLAGIASLHAHNVAGLGRGDDAGRAEWIHALEHPGAPRRFERLSVWRGGANRGPIVGGNLTVLFTCAAARRLQFPDGAILFLEDVGEAPYRVDRMLSALIASGALDRIGGVLVGDFTDSPPGRHGVPVEAVLRERLSQLAVPVLAGFPAGHARRNAPLHFGLTATVDGSLGAVELGAHSNSSSSSISSPSSSGGGARSG
jgi:muramoyltetrapeptide carboxypeptidase